MWAPVALAADVNITTDTASVNLDAYAGTTAQVANGVTVGFASPALSATLQAWSVTNNGAINGGNTVTLDQGGTFINASGASLTGSLTAITLGYKPFSLPPAGGPGVLHNYGTIAGGVEGVTIWFGGTVNNYFGGTITTANGVNAVSIGQGTSRTLFNAGTISAPRLTGFSTGVLMQGGPSTFTNTSTGTIFGDYNGVYGSSTVIFTFDNAGSITSRRGPAVEATSGGSLINSGTIDSTNSHGILIRNNANADITNSGTIGGALGAISFALAGGTANPAAVHTLRLNTGSVLNGNVIGGTNTDNLILQGLGTESIAKFLNFETLSMQGSDWTLTGTGTFATSTTVQSGRLSVNGTLASPTLTVDAPGTLSGSGAITGNVVNNGTLAPGNSIGTLTVAGNYLQASGSTYVVEIDATPASDRINVTGTATIQAGTTVTVVAAPGAYNVGTRYTILNALGGVAGTYSSLTNSFAFLDVALAYDPNNVFLDILALRATFASVAQSRNQVDTAAAAQALGPGNAVFDAILTLDAPGARNAFDQLSGVIHASLKSALIDDSSLVRDAIVGRLRQFGDGVHALLSPVVSTMRYADDEEEDDDLPDGVLAHSAQKKAKKKRAKVPAIVSKGPPAPPALVWTGWAQVIGQWGRYDSDGNAAAMTSSTGGFISGIDATWNGTYRAGLAAGYHATSLKENAVASTADIDSYHLAAYAASQHGPFGLRGGLAWTWHDIDTSRSIAFSGFADAARAQYDGRTFQVFGEAAYRTSLGPVALEPFAALAYVNLKTDGFTETGGAAALTGLSGTEDMVFSTLGIRAAHVLQLGWRTAILARGALGWRHAFSGVTPTALLAFAAGGTAPFLIAGVPIGEDSLVAEAGFDIALSPSATLGLTYAGQFAGNAKTNAIKGNVMVRF